MTDAGLEVYLHQLLISALRWRGMVSFIALPFSPRGSSPLYPMHGRLGGLESWSERYTEDKNHFSLSGIEPGVLSPAYSLVAMSTELCLLLLSQLGIFCLYNALCNLVSW